MTLGWAYFLSGCTREGVAEIERAVALSPNNWLERAVKERDGPVFGLKGSFLFSSLHAHPRFRAILRELRLA